MSLRSAVRGAAKPWLQAALRSGGLRRTCAAALRRSVKIVVGHYFGVSRPYLFMRPGIAIDDLHRALALLSQHFEFASLDQLIAEGRNPSPSRRLAVTIDDGFDLLREGAIDVFDAFKVPVTTFVVVDAIDNRALIWPNKLRAIETAKGLPFLRAKLAALHERHGMNADFVALPTVHVAMLGWPASRKDALADELWRACDMPPLVEYLDQHRPFYSLAQLRELLRRGHGIGLHTRSHPFCDVLGDDEVDDEFRRPARWLQQNLGLGAVAMAYPFGIRLPPEQEHRLAREGIVSCALGLGEFSRAPTEPSRLDRASLEGDMVYNVFAAPVIRRLVRATPAADGAALN